MSSALATKAARIIVVDDASTDTTSALAEACDDGSGRLLVLRQSENTGPSGARNRALDQADTTWFTVLDADDCMDEGRIARLEALAADQYDLLADDMWIVPDNGSLSERTALIGLPETAALRPFTMAEFVEGNLPRTGARQKELGFIKPLIRMSLMEELSLRYAPDMRLDEDYDLYVRLLAGGARAAFAPAQGYVAFRRADSLSRTHGHHELGQAYQAAIAHMSLPGLDGATRSAMARLRTHISGKYRWAKFLHDAKALNVLGVANCFLTSPGNIAQLLGRIFGAAQQKLFAR